MPLYRFTGSIDFVRFEPRALDDDDISHQDISYKNQAIDWEAEGETPKRAFSAAVKAFTTEREGVAAPKNVEWLGEIRAFVRETDDRGRLIWTEVSPVG